MKRFITSGELCRLFQEQDEKTILRRPNCRKFCLDNDIYMEIHEKAWLIDFQAFMEKVNLGQLDRHYELPKMRNIKQCVDLWNKKHKRKRQIIDKHTVERCMKEDSVFAYHHGKRWVINYDQLEIEIEKFFKETNYKLVRRKRR